MRSINPSTYNQKYVNAENRAAFKEEFLKYCGFDKEEYFFSFYDKDILDKIHDQIKRLCK